MQKGTSGPHLNYYMLGNWNEISFAYRWMMHSNESLSPWWKSIMSSPGIHGFVSSNLSLQYRKIMENKQSVLILIKVNWFTFIRNLDYNFMFSSIILLLVDLFRKTGSQLYSIRLLFTAELCWWTNPSSEPVSRRKKAAV